MDFSADCTILTAMISRVQSYEKQKKQKKFPGIFPILKGDSNPGWQEMFHAHNITT